MGDCETIRLTFAQPVASVTTVPAKGNGSASTGQGGGDETTHASMQELLESEIQQLRSAQTALQQGAEQLVEARQEMLAKVEGQLVDLAMDIARKALMQEIQAGRYEIEPIVTEALCHVPIRQNVVIRLNPQDYAKCEMVHSPTESAGTGEVRFISDPAVQLAQCIVETSEGIIESSFESNINSMAEALHSAE